MPCFNSLVSVISLLWSDKTPFLRVAAHRLRNFLLMVAMHDYYYCIPLQHKDKVPAEGAAH